MGTAVTVLVVDDSLVVRGAIVRLLRDEPGIEVVATAGDGQSALDKVRNIQPDVVLLDIEMPRMDGLQFLSELSKFQARPTVLVLSSLTTRGAMVTLEALSRGAADYVTKPSTLGKGISPQELARSLATRIRVLGRTRGEVAPARPAPKLPQAPTRPPAAKSSGPHVIRAAKSNAPVGVVAIGASTGGPNALMDLLRAFPASFSVPILIVQHMPALFTSQLARSLDKHCALPAKEVSHGDLIEPGVIYIARGNYHMRVRRFGGRVQAVTDQTEPVRSCRPSVDVLFESVAKCYGPSALGVVLTGMGSDGLDGSRLLTDQGGVVLTQDEESSVVWGMPGDVTRAGLSSAVLPLERIGPEILARVLSWSKSQRPRAGEGRIG